MTGALFTEESRGAARGLLLLSPYSPWPGYCTLKTTTSIHSLLCRLG